MKTIKLKDGKYSIVFDDKTWQVVDFLRYGESWPAGNELHYSGVVTALIHRVIELEANASTPAAQGNAKDAVNTELLDALKGITSEVCKWIDMSSTKTHINMKQSVNRARAAIATKAAS